jgi:hypothetical protein
MELFYNFVSKNPIHRNIIPKIDNNVDLLLILSCTCVSITTVHSNAARPAPGDSTCFKRDPHSLRRRITFLSHYRARAERPSPYGDLGRESGRVRMNTETQEKTNGLRAKKRKK